MSRAAIPNQRTVSLKSSSVNSKRQQQQNGRRVIKICEKKWKSPRRFHKRSRTLIPVDKSRCRSPHLFTSPAHTTAGLSLANPKRVKVLWHSGLINRRAPILSEVARRFSTLEDQTALKINSVKQWSRCFQGSWSRRMKPPRGVKSKAQIASHGLHLPWAVANLELYVSGTNTCPTLRGRWKEKSLELRCLPNL